MEHEYGTNEVRAQRRDWSDGINILMRQKMPRGYAYAQPVIMDFKENREGQLIEPTFVLSFSEAQVLMDDLWQAGLRPSEGSGSAGSLKATQEHLQDMRKLVFTEDERS